MVSIPADARACSMALAHAPGEPLHASRDVRWAAGLPLSVIERAKTILAKLESENLTPSPEATPEALIRRLALESSIPVVERKDLARVLYANVEIGQQVPAEQYAAVAYRVAVNYIIYSMTH